MVFLIFVKDQKHPYLAITNFCYNYRMNLYRYSPIQSKEQLFEAIEHVHAECYKLCKESFGEYYPNAGNMGIFCHYEDEYKFLTAVRKELTESSDNPDQKYFTLLEPIIIPARDDVPETTYTHLYIRKPDPYRHHVGDVDFYIDPEEYQKLKQSLLDGEKIAGARIFPRSDLDMIELHNPDTDALAYLSPKSMAEKVRIKLSDATNL